jgi:hypothetical protein
MSTVLESLSPVKGEYYLIERSKVDELYEKAGFHENSEEVPNFITVDGKECLFTENFVELKGKEYEIVMISSGFHWEDVLVYENDENDDE